MEWVSGEDLLKQDSKVTCCDQGSFAVFVCLSPQCRYKQRIVCKRCSLVHQDHQNDLIDVKRFAIESSSRHDTARKLQLYEKDNTSKNGPVNSIDSILIETFLKEKSALMKRLQEIQDRLSLNLKKQLGHMDAYRRTQENVRKLEKRKGESLATFPSPLLEMIIDIYWGLDQRNQAENKMPNFLESELTSCLKKIISGMEACFESADNEVDRCLSRVSFLLKGERFNQFSEEEFKFPTPVKFPYQKKAEDIAKRKIVINSADIDTVCEKVNQHHEKVLKDYGELQDNKTILLNENSHLQNLNNKHFASIGEKIEWKKNEIGKLEKAKDLQNLYIARNQLSNLIRMQVQQYKSFNAQQVRVDTRMQSVMKNIEVKQEELKESKTLISRVLLQKNQKCATSCDEREVEKGDGSIFLFEETTPRRKQSQSFNLNTAPTTRRELTNPSMVEESQHLIQNQLAQTHHKFKFKNCSKSPNASSFITSQDSQCHTIQTTPFSSSGKQTRRSSSIRPSCRSSSLINESNILKQQSPLGFSALIRL